MEESSVSGEFSHFHMFDRPERGEGLVTEISTTVKSRIILGDPGAGSRDDGIFMGESLQQ